MSRRKRKLEDDRLRTLACLVRAAFSLLKLDAAQTSHVLPPVWQCVGTVAVAKNTLLMSK